VDTASQWSKTRDESDPDHRQISFASSSPDKNRLRIELLKVRLDKADAVETLLRWNDVSVDRLVVHVRKKDADKGSIQ
jgi:hypothetical protein